MYPKIPNFNQLTNLLGDYARLKHEYGADNEAINSILDELENKVKNAIDLINALPDDQCLCEKEPNELDKIKALRPNANKQKLWDRFDDVKYADKLAGAFLARAAGCTLGAIVEFWDLNEMRAYADYIGDQYPPVDYWSKIKDEKWKRYGKTACLNYTRGHIDGIPVDDDLAYTQLGLLIAEDHGVNFTTDDVGKAWLKYLPYACTAEDVALTNLKAGVKPILAAEINNPFVQWIGADIRSDPFGYMAPAMPERAAEMAYYEAYISHRRNGIYGEMFFSAVIAAAFAVDNAVDALKIGLNEIPKDCLLANDVRWAIEESKNIHNYEQARSAVDERFKGMSGVHTNNNACLTIFGLTIGGDDVTKVIGETVAMGLDNDCTAATAGSIVGAIVGHKNVPKHWYEPFGNTSYSYLIGIDSFKIDDLLNRFTVQAKKVWGI